MQNPDDYRGDKFETSASVKYNEQYSSGGG